MGGTSESGSFTPLPDITGFNLQADNSCIAPGPISTLSSIGYLQSGQHLRPELAQNRMPLLPPSESVLVMGIWVDSFIQAGPFPSFDLTYPYLPNAWPPPLPPARQSPVVGSGVNRVPLPTPQDVEGYTALFEIFGAVDGLMSGDTAKGVFQRANLPNQTLGMIWSLADSQRLGALGPVEFVVAMHLITLTKAGTLTSLPSVLPPAVFEAAGRGHTPSNPFRRLPGRGCPPSTFPGPSIPKQYGGPLLPQRRDQSPRRSAPPVTQPVQRGSADGWAISAAEKDRFDVVYSTIDVRDKGYITKVDVIPLFSSYSLPPRVLARIYDLADTNGTGLLSREEFAIAMYLIQEQRDNPGPLPAKLPANLYPPSAPQQWRQFSGVGNSHRLFAHHQANIPAALTDDSIELSLALALALAPPPPPPPATPTETRVPFVDSDTNVLDVADRPSTPQWPNYYTAVKRTSGTGTPPGFRSSIIVSRAGGSGRSAPSEGRAPLPATKGLPGGAGPEASKKKPTSEASEQANLSEKLAADLRLKREAEESSRQVALNLHREQQEVTEQILADRRLALRLQGSAGPPAAESLWAERVPEGCRRIARFLGRKVAGTEEGLASRRNSAVALDTYLPAETLRAERIPENYRKFSRFLGRVTRAGDAAPSRGPEAEMGAGGSARGAAVSDRHPKLLPEGQAELSQIYSRFKRYRTRQCSTCFDSYPKASTINAPCKHTYCNGCMRDFFLHAAADEELFPPRCCSKEIPLNAAKKVLSVQQLSEFLSKSTEFRCNNRTYCYAASCSRFIPSVNTACDVAQCLKCGKQTCTMCKKKAHGGECPNDEDLALTLRLAESEGWQRCIRCRAVVMKSFGCHHMTCRCGAEWCYACGVKYKNCTCGR